MFQVTVFFPVWAIQFDTFQFINPSERVRNVIGHRCTRTTAPTATKTNIQKERRAKQKENQHKNHEMRNHWKKLKRSACVATPYL